MDVRSSICLTTSLAGQSYGGKACLGRSKIEVSIFKPLNLLNAIQALSELSNLHSSLVATTQIRPRLILDFQRLKSVFNHRKCRKSHLRVR